MGHQPLGLAMTMAAQQSTFRDVMSLDLNPLNFSCPVSRAQVSTNNTKRVLMSQFHPTS